MTVASHSWVGIGVHEREVQVMGDDYKLTDLTGLQQLNELLLVHHLDAGIKPN
jgi:hypothetical protein